MKYIIGIMIFSLSYVFLYGQIKTVETDTVFAKGYILKEIAKQDVLKYRKSAKRKLRNKKKFELSIDLNERYIYLPIENELSISTILDSINSSKISKFYTFCPIQKPITIFNNILGYENYDFSCKLPPFTSDNLYKIKGYRYQVYEIYYIEGTWLKMKYNPKLDYLVSSFKVELINTDKEFIDLYYLLDCKNFEGTPDISEKRIKKLK
ncbi:MAG: hypothetical protein SF052_09710 [Bacteroidia bacterium]|nr:hypothetical protein [Bacteroidia bacterium]